MQGNETQSESASDQLIEYLKMENNMLKSYIKFLQDIIQEKNHERGLG
jgi:hypothetical protein